MHDANSVPSESDWGDYWNDQDRTYAHDQFNGKTLEEMIPRFRDFPLSASEDLMNMPDIPFRYYVFGFKDMLTDGGSFPQEFLNLNEHDLAIETFLGLLIWKLEHSPQAVLPIMEELMTVAEYVATNAQRLEIDPCCDDYFLEKLQRIRTNFENVRHKNH